MKSIKNRPKGRKTPKKKTESEKKSGMQREEKKNAQIRRDIIILGLCVEPVVLCRVAARRK
jgi:hypothetical protein